MACSVSAAARRRDRLPGIAIGLAVLIATAPLELRAEDLPTVSAQSFQDEVEPCYRPERPVPSLFATRTDFIAARETYYRDVSRYLSLCIDGWVQEARSRYQEMFQAEVQAFMLERQAVLDDVRRAVAENY